MGHRDFSSWSSEVKISSCCSGTTQDGTGAGEADWDLGVPLCLAPDSIEKVPINPVKVQKIAIWGGVVMAKNSVELS